MKCPVCDVALAISSREGIEIDYCPQCRGVWLDRGELDKIIERAGVSTAPPVASERDRYAPRREEWSERRYEQHDRDPQRYDYDDYGHRKKRKKRGFLEDLFEFGD